MIGYSFAGPQSGTGTAIVPAGAAGLVAFCLLFAAPDLVRAQQADAPVDRIAEPDAMLELEERTRDLEDDAAVPNRNPGVDVDMHTGGGGTPSELVHVPVVKLYPGAVRVDPDVTNPVAGEPDAVQRGMQYFNQFNCIGCHAPNGAGGMGPSLSNSTFIYGEEPENIYLSILQGRPAGMPAWGGMLPDHVIWDLVAYIKSISKEPSGPWGSTTSVDGFTVEQVPAEFMRTVDPWAYTNQFSYGQPPFVKPRGSPPLETPAAMTAPE